MTFYLMAVVLALVGVVLIGVAVAIRSAKALTGEEEGAAADDDEDAGYGDLGCFLVGILLEALALVLFVVTYIVRNA